MAVTNTLKQQVDLPVWEWCRFAPTATALLSATCTVDDGSDRYIYYLTTSSFYRYDTYADSWQQLATPVTTPVTVLSMRYIKERGTHGRVISATSTSVVIGGLRGNTLDGKTIRIVSGTGAGQERTLTYTGETISDMGVITATTTTTLADSTKKWKYNQWSGYMVGITFGTDATQYKRILYNDTTTLYISDVNLQPHDHWNNQPFIAVAPYALPVVTVGSQAHYQILSHSYTVSTWTTTPDYTSFFTTLTGGIYLFSAAAAAPFWTWQYYDVIADSWTVKTVNQGFLLAAVATDCTIENLSKAGSVFISSTATSGGARTLTDTGQAMTVDRYANYRILITGGTGCGQSRRIICNTATVFTVERPWDISLDGTSTYQVWGDYDKIFSMIAARSMLNAYSVENDYWMQGNDFDNGVTCNMAVKMNGWKPVGVTSGTRIAAGVTAVAPAPTAGGSGYLVGDILTCSVGGTGAKVIVTSIDTTGAVLSIELVASGTVTGFTTGSGKATTGGTGTSCTINITSVGPTCLVTTAINHWFKTGDTVTISGDSGTYNGPAVILGVSGLTTFDIATASPSSMAAANSQSTTVIVDSSKNWTPNEFIGKMIHLSVAGTGPTAQVRWITANTATTITVATIVAGVNGTSKYQIYDTKSFGCDNQFKPANQQNWGHASSGSTTTLVDSSKNWVVNCWSGYKLRIEDGTGFASGIITITNNTATTLTYSVQSFTPDATTHYEIADSWGLVTTGGTTTPVTEASTKNWTTNMWAGKSLRITGGTALGQETAITSNTSTAITTAALTLTDNTSTYAIIGVASRGTATGGFELLWMFGNSNAATKGKYFFCARGSTTNNFDIYDITTSRWNYGYFFSPQSETLTAGSMYAYDGVDTIYIQKDATGRVFSWNMTTNAINNLGMVPYGHGTAVAGNRMEIVVTADGLKYLYMMRHTGQEMWRVLIFF